MGETTGISWTDATWNPWMGCKHVSPGCDHCYMFRDQRRYGHDPEIVRRAAKATFFAPYKWEEHAAQYGLQTKVFTCSWSDFFIREADPWREEAWEIMRATPHLTYQVLTKRPGLLIAWAKTHGWLPNVWAGVSVESQKYAPRLDVLGRLRDLPGPPVILFASCEPLLGPLDLSAYLSRWVSGGIDWVIVGGESGPDARKMQDSWARDLRNQCANDGVAYFFKQWGGTQLTHGDRLDGVEHHEFPAVKVAAA